MLSKTGSNWLFLTLMIFMITRVLSAQEAQPNFHNFTTDDGLPSNECYEIIQDQKGYIWISTDNGVSRYDGYEFKNFGPEDGLLDRTILFMHEDHRGWIWMNSIEGNFYIYRGDTIATYPYNSVIQSRRSKFDIVHDFFVDKEGILHASLEYDRILQISPFGDTSSWHIPYRHSTRGIYQKDDFALQLTDINRLLKYDSTLYLYLFDANQQSLIDSVSYSARAPQTNTNKASAYGFSLRQHQKYIFNLANDIYFYDKEFNLNEIRKSKGTINYTYTKKDGSILIGYFNNKGGEEYESYEALVNNTPKSIFLSNLTISHLLEDTNGGTWITTIEKGIFYSANTEHTTIDFDLISDDKFTTLTSTNSHLYCGSKNGTIFQLDKNKSLKKLPPINFSSLDEMFIYPKENMLLCSSPVIFFSNQKWQKVFSAKGEKKSTLINIRPINTLLPTPNIPTLYSSNNIATIKESHKESWQLDVQLKIDIPYIVTALLARDSTYWLASRQGLYTFKDTLQQKNVKYLSATPIPLLKGKEVIALNQTQSNKIICVTKENGIYLFLPDNKWVHFELTLSGVDNRILKVLFLTDSTILLLTRTEVYHIKIGDNGISSTLHCATPNKGQFIDFTVFEESIWLITENQLYQYPLSCEPVYSQLLPKLNNVRLNGKLINNKNKYILPARHNLRLQFSPLDLASTIKKPYRFRLSSSADWTLINEPIINLIDLSPGQYEIEFQRSRWDDSWISASSISLRITPPFYQQWWFILALVIAAGLIIYSYAQNRIEALKKQQRQLELEEQINQLKHQAYQAQMNPHFIFNCLNAIQGFMMGNKEDVENAIQLLSRFSVLIRRTLSATRNEKISLKEDVEILQSYLSLERMRFNKCFDYHLTIDEQLETDWLYIPPLLIQPYVENAVLYGVSEKKGDGSIQITIQQKGEQIIFKIIDNGIGIHQSKKSKLRNRPVYRKSVGLELAEQRILLFTNNQGLINIKEIAATNKSGTIVEVILPLRSFQE